jgi:hypothetical protein
MNWSQFILWHYPRTVIKYLKKWGYWHYDICKVHSTSWSCSLRPTTLKVLFTWCW